MSASDENEVRLEDQQNINKFGTLNNRLIEVRSDLKQANTDVEIFEDATTEMMMVSGGKIMIFIAESFIEADEDIATAYCEKKSEQLQEKITKLKCEEESILNQQESLKKVLYGRFGDSINLEN
mmetsp:Transcript_27493/g.27714  ORF Transcript_27493/g.27714 Transcript_27493/m.27714 type:complete len:124 (-) Transcript_27493:88-459(-)